MIRNSSGRVQPLRQWTRPVEVGPGALRTLRGWRFSGTVCGDHVPASATGETCGRHGLRWSERLVCLIDVVGVVAVMVVVLRVVVK